MHLGFPVLNVKIPMTFSHDKVASAMSKNTGVVFRAKMLAHAREKNRSLTFIPSHLFERSLMDNNISIICLREKGCKRAAHQVAGVKVALEVLVGAVEAVGVTEIVGVPRGPEHPAGGPRHVIAPAGAVVPVHHAAAEGHVRLLTGGLNGVAQPRRRVLQHVCNVNLHSKSSKIAVIQRELLSRWQPIKHMHWTFSF